MRSYEDVMVTWIRVTLLFNGKPGNLRVGTSVLCSHIEQCKIETGHPSPPLSHDLDDRGAPPYLKVWICDWIDLGFQHGFDKFLH